MSDASDAFGEYFVYGEISEENAGGEKNIATIPGELFFAVTFSIMLGDAF